MEDKKIIRLTAKDLLNLIRNNETSAVIEEVYFDLDAEDYLRTGKEPERIVIQVKD